MRYGRTFFQPDFTVKTPPKQGRKTGRFSCPEVIAARHENFGKFFQPSSKHQQISKEIIMGLRKELLEILVCPKCKGKIYEDEKQSRLICEACKLIYEIKDGIPVMLIEEAKPLEEAS